MVITYSEGAYLYRPETERFEMPRSVAMVMSTYTQARLGALAGPFGRYFSSSARSSSAVPPAVGRAFTICRKHFFDGAQSANGLEISGRIAHSNGCFLHSVLVRIPFSKGRPFTCI